MDCYIIYLKAEFECLLYFKTIYYGPYTI